MPVLAVWDAGWARLDVYASRTELNKNVRRDHKSPCPRRRTAKQVYVCKHHFLAVATAFPERCAITNAYAIAPV